MASNDSVVKAEEFDAYFRQSDIGGSVSEFVLMCLKRLNDCYPRAVDMSAYANESEMGPEGSSALGLFRDSGFIAGSLTQTILTLRGHKSIRVAIASECKVAKFFLGKPIADPDQVLLALWRTHFYTWDQN